MTTVYAGLDAGSGHCHQVALQPGERVIRNQQFATSEVNLVKAFAELSGEIHVHLEASELAPWVRSCIGPMSAGWSSVIREPTLGSPKTLISQIPWTPSSWPSYCASGACTRFTIPRSNRVVSLSSWSNVRTRRSSCLMRVTSRKPRSAVSYWLRETDRERGAHQPFDARPALYEAGHFTFSNSFFASINASRSTSASFHSARKS